MITAEFGIIPEILTNEIYTNYEPQKYDCIKIDDDLYINDWWPQLQNMKTYFNELNSPAKGLNRHGVTLIPPISLGYFENIIKNDLRLFSDPSLKKLLMIIQKAISENKYIIHYGV